PIWPPLPAGWPVVAMEVRRPPNRFMLPSLTGAGPSRISLRVPSGEVLTLVPLGRSGWKVAIPQWWPRPGASTALARGGGPSLGPPGRVGWEVAHPPGVPPPGALARPGKGRADHHGVGPAGDR